MKNTQADEFAMMLRIRMRNVAFAVDKHVSASQRHAICYAFRTVQAGMPMTVKDMAAALNRAPPFLHA